LGRLLRDSLAAGGWRIVNSTPLPLVCFTRDGLVPATFLVALHQRQIAWMSEAKLGGVPVLRACITSFKTTETDIEGVVEKLNGLATEFGLLDASASGVAQAAQPVAATERRTEL
jgi:hypothetical protein